MEIQSVYGLYMTVNTIKNEHFTTLEWFRFILSLYIVIFHTFNYSTAPTWIREVFETGFFATSSFFVLSGFILAHVYLRNKGTPNVSMREPPKDFFIKRFANLYPIHIISMFLFMIVLVTIPYANINPGDANVGLRAVTLDATNGVPYSELRHVMSNTELVLNFFMHLFMVQAWNAYYMAYNFPTWSISTLFFFYLVFPYAAIKIHQLKKPYFFLFLLNAVAIIPVVLCLLYTDMGNPEAGFLHRNPLVRLPEFLGGILLCHIYHQNKLNNKLPTAFGMVKLFLVIVVFFTAMRSFLYAMTNYWDSWYIAYHLLHNGLVLTLEMLIIYFFVNLPQITNEKINYWGERLGNSSLPLFALHIPIYSVFSRIHKLLAGNPSLCFEDFRGCVAAATVAPDYRFYLLYLIITIIICVYFQEKIVVPIRKTIIKHGIKK